MITEVLLVLHLYLILFFIWLRFRNLIKIIASAEDVLNDVVDTPGEELKSIIDKGKLGNKWTHKRVEKASDEIINKTYANTSSVNWMKRVKKLERHWVSMSLIYTLLEFLDGLKSRMLKNYAKTLVSFCVYVW